jgi:hypothetical protein
MRFVSNMMQRSLCANIISSVHLEPDAKVSCANMTFSKRFVLNKMQRSLVLTPQPPLGDLSCIQSKSCANIISPMRRLVPTMQGPLVNCKMQRKTSEVWKKMGKQRGDQARFCCLPCIILLPLPPWLCCCCSCFWFCFTFPMSYTVCTQNILPLLMHRRHVLRRVHATTLNFHRVSA